MWALTLWAEAERADKDPFRQPEVIWGTVGLAVALLAGALVVWMVDRWRKRSTIVSADTGTELTEYRDMYERGEITEEEYAKLRSRVAQKIKAPPPAASASTDAPTPGPARPGGGGPANTPPPA